MKVNTMKVNKERKYLLPLNLQTFSEEEVELEIEEEDGIDIPEPEEDEDQEELDTDPDNEPDIEEPEAQEDVEDHEEQNLSTKNETGNAVRAERQKWKGRLQTYEKESALAKRMMKQIGVSSLEEFERRLDEIESQRLQDHGVPPEMADRIARTEREINQQKSELKRQRYEAEANKLKSDPFFADIEEYLDELMDVAEQTGFSIEDAYMAKHGKRRFQQRETEIEAKVKSNREKREAKRVDVSPTGASSNQKKRVSLSSEERAIAKAAGMTPEEYAKYK